MSLGELNQVAIARLAEAGPYPFEAYGFVHAGLGYTVRRIHGEAGSRGSGAQTGPSRHRERLPAATSPKPGQGAGQGAGKGALPQHRVEPDDEQLVSRTHVSGQQLCLGLRDFAIERFGLFAPVVFEHWHIQRTEDFGRMVFAMIDVRLMSRNDDDTIEDFRGVYDFDEALSRDALLRGIGLRPTSPQAGLRRDA